MHINKPYHHDYPQRKITLSLFNAALKCMTKCFLRSQGETGGGNEYARWAMNRAEIYRKDGVRHLISKVEYHDGRTINLSEMGNLKTPKWILAVNLEVRTQNLESTLDAVERVQVQGRRNSIQFIPIRFASPHKLARDDRLAIAFDGFVLSEVLRHRVSFGKIIHGDSHAKSNVKISSLSKDVQKLILKIEAMLSTHSPPELILNRHCPECEFQIQCKQKAIERDDLILLGRMTEQDRKKFNSKGIFTIAQLSYTFRPRRRPRWNNDKREKYHHSLRALSIRERKIHIVGRPELKTEGKKVFIDVEGLPEHDSYYLIGIRVKTPEGILQHSLWADRPEEEEKIWTDFLGILSEIDNPILIHYGSFESTFIKRMCARYGRPPEESLLAKTVRSTINLISVIFAQIYFSTLSNSLKEISEYLGFKWSGPISSGLQAVAFRHQWEATREPSLKEVIISYNVQDCEALQIVTSKVSDLTQSFLDDPCQSSKDAVHTETMRRDHPSGFSVTFSPFQTLMS